MFADKRICKIFMQHNADLLAVYGAHLLASTWLFVPFFFFWLQPITENIYLT